MENFSLLFIKLFLKITSVIMKVNIWPTENIRVDLEYKPLETGT